MIRLWVRRCEAAMWKLRSLIGTRSMRTSGHSSIAFTISASPSSISPPASARSRVESGIHRRPTDARCTVGCATVRGFAFAAAGIPSLTVTANFQPLRDEENPADCLPALYISVRCRCLRQREGAIDHDLELATSGFIDKALYHIVSTIGAYLGAQEYSG